jgi:broad specificity phosphatase PhoE
VVETPVTIYLIRHARAGDALRWRGDDRKRPLTPRGQRQAEALAAALEHAPIRRIVSSPYLRCHETVAPLARRLGLPIETSSTLAVGAEADAVLALISSMPDVTALCSHGDVIPTLLECLAAQGLLSPSAIRCAKGSTWVLERTGGQLTSARYLPAPSGA